MKIFCKFVIYFLSFITGFSFMGYEILGSRILAPYFGGSIYTWGAIISVFMFGLSIGYAFGGKIADKRKNFLDLFYVFGIAVLFLLLVSVYGKFICIIFLKYSFDVRYLALSASLILFFLPSFLWGIILPYLIKMTECSLRNIGASVGKIYSISTIGSIFGVLFVSFYMVGIVGTSQCVRIICIPLFLGSTISLILDRMNRKTE
jgi:MFS family permease